MQPPRTVRELIDRKGHHIFAVLESAALAECARVMVENEVGALVVMRDGSLVGIITRNDLLRALGSDPEHAGDTVAADVMSNHVEVATDTDDLETVRRRMVDEHIRHMPVVQGTEVTGMLTLSDVLTLELADADRLSDELARYVRIGHA